MIDTRVDEVPAIDRTDAEVLATTECHCQLGWSRVGCSIRLPPAGSIVTLRAGAVSADSLHRSVAPRIRLPRWLWCDAGCRHGGVVRPIDVSHDVVE